MTILETERLALRMFTSGDVDALDRIFSKPTVMKYLGYAGEPMTRGETEAALHSMIEHWGRHGYGRWAVTLKDSGRLIGCSGLRSFNGTAELVYLLDEPYWGHGLATETARACLDFGFFARDFPRIIAFARPANIASRRVMVKVGMSYLSDNVIFGIKVAQYTITRKAYRCAESSSRPRYQQPDLSPTATLSRMALPTAALYTGTQNLTSLTSGSSGECTGTGGNFAGNA